MVNRSAERFCGNARRCLFCHSSREAGRKPKVSFTRRRLARRPIAGLRSLGRRYPARQDPSVSPSAYRLPSFTAGTLSGEPPSSRLAAGLFWSFWAQKQAKGGHSESFWAQKRAKVSKSGPKAGKVSKSGQKWSSTALYTPGYPAQAGTTRPSLTSLVALLRVPTMYCMYHTVSCIYTSITPGYPAQGGYPPP